MIKQLRGKVVEKKPPSCIIDVHGVGYEVIVPMSTLYELPNLDESILVYTQLIIREDAHILYGFAKPIERDLFNQIIKTNGIGPKIALAILSAMAVDEFVAMIQSGNIAALTKVPGIGKKTAERLSIEMQDRLNDWSQSSSSHTKDLNTVTLTAPPGSVSLDATEALISLGYKPKDAQKAVAAVFNENASTESLIKEALKHLY